MEVPIVLEGFATTNVPNIPKEFAMVDSQSSWDGHLPYVALPIEVDSYTT